MDKVKDNENFRAWFCLKMALDNISASLHHLKTKAVYDPLKDELEQCRHELSKIQKQILQENGVE